MPGSKIVDEHFGHRRKSNFSHFSNLINVEDAKKLVLQCLAGDGEVVDYGLRPYSEEKIGYLSSHYRLEIKARKKELEDCPGLVKMAFFVKAIPYEVPTQAQYVQDRGVFRQETIFFEKVVPELRRDFNSEPWAPECYIVKNDCLVFEELCVDGFRMSDKFLNEREIRAGLGAIARLHAASLHAETRLGRALNEIFPEAFEERVFLHRGNQSSWYLAGIDVAVKIAELMGLETTKIPAACSHVYDAIKPSATKQNVASHGDLWSNNLMFDQSVSPRCRLVDFQLARYSPLAHDVAQFLYLSSSRKFRDDNSAAMLRHYWDCLRDCIAVNSSVNVEIPSWRDFVVGFEEQRLGALVTAVMYFPTVLLDGLTGARIMNDSEKYKKFVMVDRRNTVVENMQRDSGYREKLEDAVRELVELSDAIDRLPKPC